MKPRAGFEVVGVDIEPQPNYPFQIEEADALAYLREHVWVRSDYAAIHASPPCQAYTAAQRLRGREHPDLIAPTRSLLQASGLPYVIENVPGSPLIDPVVLEGQMFEGLRTIRPRHFETNWPLEVALLRPPRPRQTKMGRRPVDGEWMQIVGNFSDVDAGRKAMGIDWMTRDELSESIPPAYTELVGHQLMQHIGAVAA